MASPPNSAHKKGKKPAPPPAPSAATGRLTAPLDAASLRLIYEEMLRCWSVGTLVTERLGWPALGGVREAVVVASAIDLRTDDLFLSALGSYAAALVRGASIASVLAACAAAASSGAAPTLDPGSEIRLATGAAVAMKMAGANQLVTVLASDVPATLEPWADALRFAVLHRLPVIYVVEVPAGRSSLHAAELRSQASGYGLPAITVDGHDAVAILRVCQEARQKARQGYGPTLVECCAFADPVKPSESAPDEVQLPPDADTLDAMVRYLKRRHHFDQEWQQRLTSRLSRELTAAVKSMVVAGKGRAAGRRKLPISDAEKIAMAEMALFPRPAEGSR